MTPEEVNTYRLKALSLREAINVVDQPMTAAMKASIDNNPFVLGIKSFQAYELLKRAITEANELYDDFHNLVEKIHKEATAQAEKPIETPAETPAEAPTKEPSEEPAKEEETADAPTAE